MKQDRDLTFLAACPNEDLRTLCDLLTHNKKGDLRLSEQLTDSDAYLRCYPEQMQLMTTDIGAELRRYGSNTVKTLFRRGEADSYETIVRRVCKKMNVQVLPTDSVAVMERRLLTTLCEQTTRRLSDEELRRMADEAGIAHKRLDAQMLTAILLRVARSNVHLLSRFVAGRYLSLAAGPIGWAVLAGWMVSDLVSPAYRVIIPAVVMVATMRLRQTALIEQKY